MKGKKNENKKNLALLKEFLTKLETDIKNNKSKKNEKLDTNSPK
jgi:TATA-binding protein-associated factor Taf7